MDNELLRQKSWWQRNFKWLVPVALIAAVVAVVFSFTGSMGDFAQAYADMPLYEKAHNKAASDNRVAEKLGTLKPIDKMTVAEGAVNYSEDGNAMNGTITLKGSKGKGKMDINAIKVNGAWQYNSIKVRLKNPDSEIVVL